MEIRSALADCRQVVPARRRMSETLDVTFPATFSRGCLEVQHPVQTHAKVLWSLLKHQALVIDKHVQFPFSFSIIEMAGGRNCLVLSCIRQFRSILPGWSCLCLYIIIFHLLPRWTSHQNGQVISTTVFPRC